MKATDALLADHKMIRRLLAELRPDNPRYAALLETCHRVVAGHAWFEDRLFIPAVEKSPLLARAFTDEISREHRDIETLLLLLRGPAPSADVRDAHLLQFRSLMETHFSKEEDALFPLAERILDSEGLNRIGEEMRARQVESRAAFDALIPPAK